MDAITVPDEVGQRRVARLQNRGWEEGKNSLLFGKKKTFFAQEERRPVTNPTSKP
jgi:hypothetical protein